MGVKGKIIKNNKNLRSKECDEKIGRQRTGAARVFYFYKKNKNQKINLLPGGGERVRR